MKHAALTVLLLLLMPCVATAQPAADLTAELDAYVHEVMAAYGMPGVAFAVIKDGEVVHKNRYGYANLEHQVPVTEASIFRVYSLTKPVVISGLFQLIEQGKLTLDDNITDYVEGLPASWHHLQIKHLITHSSGLPDMAPIPVFQDLPEEEAKQRVFAASLSANAGAVNDYNQTNFWLLKEILEEVTDKPMDAFILDNQFSAAPDTAFFSVDSRDIIQNRVTAYFPFAKGYTTIEHPYLQGDYAYAMNGLNITLDAFIHWSQRLRNNALMQPATRAKMWEPFPYTLSDKLFTYGWDMRRVQGHTSYGFSGSLVTAYRIFPEDDLSIIFLANGMREFFNIEDIMNAIALRVLD